MARMAGSVIVVAMLLAPAPRALAQAPQANAPAAAEQPGVTPAEIQRLFDAYTVMQAQDQLQLTDAQWAPFLTKMKALQDIRRKHQQERNRVLQDIRKLIQQGDAVDQAQFAERVKALDDLDAKAAEDVRTAYAALDAILTPRQQARFRLFEEQMERRKIELLTRARAAARRPS